MTTYVENKIIYIYIGTVVCSPMNLSLYLNAQDTYIYIYIIYITNACSIGVAVQVACWKTLSPWLLSMITASTPNNLTQSSSPAAMKHVGGCQIKGDLQNNLFVSY